MAKDGDVVAGVSAQALSAVQAQGASPPAQSWSPQSWSPPAQNWQPSPQTWWQSPQNSGASWTPASFGRRLLAGGGGKLLG